LYPLPDIPFPLLRTATLLAMLAVCPFSARAGDDAPFESWLMMNWNQRLPYALEADLDVEQRFSAEGRAWIHSEVTPQLFWNYSPTWKFGLGYQNRIQWFDDGGHVTQTTANEAVLTALARIPLADWHLSSRQRVQLGEKDGELSAFFRHQVRLEWRGNFPLRLVPFVADEWFLNMTNGEVFQNRLMAGIGYQINPAVRAEVFGMRFDRWNDLGEHSVTPVLGVKLEASF